MIVVWAAWACIVSYTAACLRRHLLPRARSVVLLLDSDLLTGVHGSTRARILVVVPLVQWYGLGLLWFSGRLHCTVVLEKCMIRPPFAQALACLCLLLTPALLSRRGNTLRRAPWLLRAERVSSGCLAGGWHW